MNIELKKFQREAVDELLGNIKLLISIPRENKICVLQSPTGSGKTVIVAKFIEELIKELPDDDLCFLWVSIGKGNLHYQSKESLDSIFDGFPLCTLVEEEFTGSRYVIEQNEVVVVNWEKLRSKDSDGNWKVKLMKDGERISFIEVLENTREYRKIILIIDESHYGFDTKRTIELKDIIKAEVTLEMSATPKLTPNMLGQQFLDKTAYYYQVKAQDVIEQGMIKKELIINDGIGLILDDEITSQELVLEAAYQKRLEIQNSFKDLCLDINPLCLIQIPNADPGEVKKDIVIKYLNDKDNINEKNGRLGIWLSGEPKIDEIDTLKHFDNTIEFLIFKQAIDTGWDCPRAHILLKLREPGNEIFEIQTVGRIMRMPQQKHYNNDILDRGYIFTNSIQIDVKREEYNPNIIKDLISKRKPIYSDIKLLSYYQNRVDFGDLTKEFYAVLESVFCDEMRIAKTSGVINPALNCEILEKYGIKLSEAIKDVLITDHTIDGKDLDITLGIQNLEIDSKIEVGLADNDLSDAFEQIIRNNLNGFAPKRSIPSAKEALYNWFIKYMGYNRKKSSLSYFQCIVIFNNEIFGRLISKATEKFRSLKSEYVKIKRNESINEWDVPLVEFYNKHVVKLIDNPKYVYDKCYLSIDRSDPEKEFEQYLKTKSDNIEWWYKNQDMGQKYFGIKYDENGNTFTFYPDYIVKFADGRIGIFDTKAGLTAKDAKCKSDSLYQYIKLYKDSKNLIGGILIQDRSDHWRIYDKDDYQYNKSDLSNWSFLDELI
jgi:type III restriction enzyme